MWTSSNPVNLLADKKQFFLVWLWHVKIIRDSRRSWILYTNFLAYCYQITLILDRFCKQAELGVPHSEIQVKLDWQLNWQAETCQIISLAAKLRLVSFQAKLIFLDGSECSKKVGILYMKFCSDVHTIMGTSHIKIVQMFKIGWGHCK